MKDAINIGIAETYSNDFIVFFKNRSIIPIIGSGLSVNAESRKGYVPDGSTYKERMINQLRESGKLTSDEIEELSHKRFSDIAQIYEDDEFIDRSTRKSFFEESFYQVKYKEIDPRKKLFDIEWPYVYSLNVDDAIENSTQFKSIILPNREFDEEILDKEKCVFKLHGDIKDYLLYKDSVKIFTAKEYAKSIMENRRMLIRLASDYGNSNILYIGCSLNDEIDLLALESLNIPSRSRENDVLDSKKYFFTINQPSKLQLSHYKQFGITDIVVFSAYEEMYTFLYKAWKESQLISEEMLDNHASFKIQILQPCDPLNQKLFFNAEYPLDLRNEKLICPSYLISRTLKRTIISDLSKYNIQIIKGNRFSGKTYFLCDIYRSIIDRNRLLFDARTHLAGKALEKILDYKNTVTLFDTDTLTREQMEKLFTSVEVVKKNNSNIIVFINGYDSEVSGLIQYLKELGQFKDNIIHLYGYALPSKLNNEEADMLNDKLTAAGMLTYSYDFSLLDFLMKSSKIGKKVNKYSKIHIVAKGVKELAFYIALCSKEVLYYKEIIALDFSDIMSEILNANEPMIEQIYTKTNEISNANRSFRKYILNSKYWLRNELAEYAKANDGYESIVQAYHYLVEHLIDFSKKDLRKKRDQYKRIVYFDVINSIFGGNLGGRRDLVVKIYEGIKDLLGGDYQFNHQRAKCLLVNAKYQYNENKKFEQYNEAQKIAESARIQVENETKKSNSNKLYISLAHIEYTIACIYVELNIKNSLTGTAQVEETIEKCYCAIRNPLNREYLDRDKKEKMNLYEIVNNGEVIKHIKNREIKEKYDFILNVLIFE